MENSTNTVLNTYLKDTVKDDKYGFSFTKENSGGLGAIIHAIILAQHYSSLHNLNLVLVEEGRKIPRFNGNSDLTPSGLPRKSDLKIQKNISSINNDLLDDISINNDLLNNDLLNNDLLNNGNLKDWHSYFTSYKFYSSSNISNGVWNSTPNGWNKSPPSNFNNKRIEWYSQQCKKVYKLRPDILYEINERIKLSGFNPDTDTVLHIRRTDKISTMKNYTENGKIVQSHGREGRESGVVPLEYYVEQTLKVWDISESKRIFLCTDDKDICEWMKNRFSKESIEVIWDKSESQRAMQYLRMINKITKDEAWEENMVGLVNMEILIRSKYLIGGRMSYFFRVAELVRYPKPTLNIKDTDKFGKAPYAELDEPFEYPIKIQKEIIPSKTNLPFPVVSLSYKDGLNSLTETLTEERIVVIKDFLSDKFISLLKRKIPEYKEQWWECAFLPYINKDDKYIYKSLKIPSISPQCKERRRFARSIHNQGHFSYSYHQSGAHKSSCRCYVCILKQVFKSDEIKLALSNIIGSKVTGYNEFFASKYQQGDFLSMHHDNNKGDYTFVLSLTSDWNPSHGGLTHFWDDKNKEVYKTVTPSFGSLLLFKLDDLKQMDHFVSIVTTQKRRYAFTGWITVSDKT